MNDVEKLIKEGSFILRDDSLRLFYKNLLKELIDIYMRISQEITVEDYYLDSKQHYASFGFKDEELSFEININNQYLELRFYLIEKFFFEDDLFFIEYRKEIVESFFKGLYKVIYYYSDNNKLLYKELLWELPVLTKYNIVEISKSKESSTKIYEGKSFFE